MIGARLLLVLAIAGVPAIGRADDTRPPRYAGAAPGTAPPTDPGIAPALPPAPAVPAPIHRVVLVASTPELAHAARTALAPWTIEVIADDRALPAPMDDAAAVAIARERGADRVAWLAGGELVVFDPSTSIADRRPAPDGASDPPAAAAVALSLKTSLRLPPPPEVAAVEPVPLVDGPETVVPPPPRGRILIVPEIAGALRMASDGTVEPQTRFAVGLGLVHPRVPRLRPSVVVGFGPAVEAGKAGLKGMWSDVEVALQLAVELRLNDTWAIVPRARVGLHRTHLSGRIPPMEDLDETAFGADVGVDLGVWWRSGRFHAGGGVGASKWLGLPDYQRRNVTVFAMPWGTGQVFGALLVDL